MNKRVVGIGLCMTAIAACSQAYAARENAIEEVTVTAQRTAESIQDVPIAVTALSGEMMEDRQIISTTDLQLNAPNVSFTATNFGGSSFSIRGIGRLVIAASGENGVSTHVNDIPVTSNLNSIEYFDVQRVEILRGPQGTLYGRNATGGAINMITNMPTFDGVEGSVDIEVGDYGHQRLKGMLNVPITDNFAIRFAGLQLERDGFIDNLAYGQVGSGGQTLSGIDDDVDGRDHWAARVTASWEISDRAKVWLSYSEFDEDSDRARITNQICQTNALPLQGCVPGGFGFESPHMGTTTGGIFGGFFGALPFGAPAPASDFERPQLGFRSMHTDFEPIFENNEELWTGGFTYDFDNYSVSVIGAYQETDYLARQDYNMDVGATFLSLPSLIPGNPVLFPAGTLFPTTAPAGRAGEDWTNPQCNYNDGTSGLRGGCVTDADETRVFSYDQASSTSEYWTAEVKLQSQLDGKFNFLVGYSAYDAGNSGDYYVFSNTLDILATVTGAFPAGFNSTRAPDNKGLESDGQAIFAEMYFNISDSLKLTFGLRQNEDNKLIRDTNVFLSANFVGLGSELSREPGFAQGGDAFNSDRAALYGAEALFNAAVGTPAFSDERLAAIRAIPLVPQPGERRALTGSPSDFQFKETTGRIGLDWAVNEDMLIYGFYSKGYKPGGFNPPVSEAFQGDIKFDFEAEVINSFEIGSKNTLLDGGMTLNASIFFYDYEGLQITRIANNSSINDNIDAEIYGLELEGVWHPRAFPAMQVDFVYSHLNTEVTDGGSVDPTNRTAGNPAWITLEEFVPGATAGVNYVADLAGVQAFTPTAISLGAAVPLPGSLYPDGTPAYYNRAFLDAVGVPTSNGLTQDLGGNSLPNSPENTFKIGVSYTFQVPGIGGTLTPRVDYYWQDDAFAREFNTNGDKIASWDQWNASVIYSSDDGRWSVRAWARNLQDEDNITGHYLTSDTSGFFRNYFLTEPRIYGASFRYSFGGQ
jgi:iron complex outermembrane receptor protein